MSHKAPPNWVKSSKKRFDTVKNGVQNARRNNLQDRPQHCSPINFDNSNKLIQVAYREGAGPKQQNKKTRNSNIKQL